MFALPPSSKPAVPAGHDEDNNNSSKNNNHDTSPDIPRVTPNILPCYIHHEGTVPVSRRYWVPVRDEGNDDHATSYFRGRKLRSRRVPIPDGYYGLVASPSPHTLPLSHRDANPDTTSSNTQTRHVADAYDHSDHYDDYGDGRGDGKEADTSPDQPPTLLTPHSTFSHIEIWAHERVPDEDDVFARGVGEWIGFAEAIHGGRTGSGGNGESGEGEETSQDRKTQDAVTDGR